MQKRVHRVHPDWKYNVTFRNVFYTAPPPLPRTRRVQTRMKAVLGLNDCQITSDLTAHTRRFLEVGVSEFRIRQQVCQDQ